MEPARGAFDPTSFATLDTAVQRARAAGLRIVLDVVHLWGPGGFADVPAWARTGDSVTTVRANAGPYLRRVAARYRDDPAVAAYDLVNEFHRFPIDQNAVLRAYDGLIGEVRRSTRQDRADRADLRRHVDRRAPRGLREPHAPPQRRLVAPRLLRGRRRRRLRRRRPADGPLHLRRPDRLPDAGPAALRAHLLVQLARRAPPGSRCGSASTGSATARRATTAGSPTRPRCSPATASAGRGGSTTRPGRSRRRPPRSRGSRGWACSSAAAAIAAAGASRSRRSCRRCVAAPPRRRGSHLAAAEPRRDRSAGPGRTAHRRRRGWRHRLRRRLRPGRHGRLVTRTIRPRLVLGLGDYQYERGTLAVSRPATTRTGAASSASRTPSTAAATTSTAPATT